MSSQYYKVVTRCAAGMLHSARGLIYNDWCSNTGLVWNRYVRYIQGEWVSAANDSRLFVFDNIKTARSFLRDMQESYTFSFSEGGQCRAVELWECEVDDIVIGYGADSIYSIDQFWTIFNKSLSQLQGDNVDVYNLWRTTFVRNEKTPIADIRSVLAKRVKLTERVYHLPSKSYE